MAFSTHISFVNGNNHRCPTEPFSLQPKRIYTSDASPQSGNDFDIPSESRMAKSETNHSTFSSFYSFLRYVHFFSPSSSNIWIYSQFMRFVTSTLLTHIHISSGRSSITHLWFVYSHARKNLISFIKNKPGILYCVRLTCPES